MWKEVASADTPAKGVPENLSATSGGVISNDFTSGNGVIDINHFNPVNLLLSATFDINVFAREQVVDADGKFASILSAKPVYVLQNCRLTNYSFSFQPGSLLFEDMSFVCTQVTEN
jgi:hypothetical protein